MKIWICRGFGRRSPPPKLAKILKISSQKSNGNLQNSEDFLEFLANFDLTSLILMQARFMEFWKSLIIRKESKKLRGKFLRFWLKNQLRFDYIHKFQWKIDFYPFSLPSSRTFLILYTSATYQNLVGRGGFGGLYKSMTSRPIEFPTAINSTTVFTRIVVATTIKFGKIWSDYYSSATISEYSSICAVGKV